jgi:isoleucyl-tRNA synthetase
MWLINLNIWKRFGGCLQIYNKDLMYKGYTIQPYSKSRNRIEFSWSESARKLPWCNGYYCCSAIKVLSHQENYYVRSFMITSVQNLQHYKLSVLDLMRFISLVDNNAGLCHLILWLWTKWLCFKNVQSIYFSLTNVVLAKNLVGKQFGKDFMKVKTLLILKIKRR